MKLIHTSPTRIDRINKDGLFEDCLFFSDSEYWMSNADSGVVYSVEIKKVLEMSNLQYNSDIDLSLIDSVLEEIKSQFSYNDVELNDEQALSLLDDSESAFDYLEDAGELSWFIQAKQGQAAKLLGFEAAQSVDEQGVVYIVPMLEREKDLIVEE